MGDYDSSIKTISERLKDEVSNKKITVDRIVQLLRNYGDGSAAIRRDSVLNLLNGKKLDTIRFTLKTLYALGDILGVDIKYLIGEQDIPSMSVPQIATETGLSEKAVRKLHLLSMGNDSTSRNRLRLINELLTSESGDDFLCSLEELEETLVTIDQLKENSWTGTPEVYNIDNLRSWERTAKYSILEAQEEFQRFLYDQMGARSTLKELTRMISNPPAEDEPPPEEDQEQQEGN